MEIDPNRKSDVLVVIQNNVVIQNI